MAEKKFPMIVQSLNHPDNPPAALMSGSLEFLKECQEMLTPEEIKQAVEEGNRLHTEAMQRIASRQDVEKNK